MDIMQQIQAQMYGVSTPAGANATTVAPGMGGLTAGLAPGIIVPLAQNDNGGGATASNGIGRLGLAILGVSILALVGFNISTRAYQA